ncbi:MAG: ubiquitin-like domain-containing protein, partial [Clostridia bacterium]|nr:ubiquitin-like domain-containing protein [Clostridia bacterium]
MLVKNTYAEGEEAAIYEAEGAKYVTFYDDGNKLIVRTEAKTVGEALNRAEIILNEGDKVEPG